MADAAEWYYAVGGQRAGPVSGAELKRLAAAGELRPADLVWQDGMAEWTAAAEINGLFPPARGGPPPLPAHPPLPATRPTSRGWQRPDPEDEQGRLGVQRGNRIGLAVVCLHISAGLYLLVGLLMFPLFLSEDRIGTGAGLALAAGMFVFCLALAAGVEIVARGLRRRKFWAWVCGLVLFVLYVPTYFLPLGVLGLWGLLDGGSRAAFGIGSHAEPGAAADPASRVASQTRSLPRRGR